MSPRSALAGTFDTIDYLVWAAFVAEYLIKLYLTPSRWTFFRRRLIDLPSAIVRPRLTVHAVVQHEKREAEHPERMLGA